MSVSEHDGPHSATPTPSSYHQKIAKPNRTLFSIEGLTRKTHFSNEEVQSLLLYYKSLTEKQKLDRLRFRDVMHITFDCTDDVMLDRIFRYFDANNDTQIDESEWVQGLSVFLRGTLEEHINFCYFIYDINGDRSLAREELYHCLKNCLIRTAGIEEDVEESIKEIVEIALKILDKDKNGQVTFSDFHAAVLGDNLLLEACGPCLPSPKTISNFFLFLNEKHPATVQSASRRGKGRSTSSTREDSVSKVLMMRRRSRRSSQKHLDEYGINISFSKHALKGEKT